MSGEGLSFSCDGGTLVATIERGEENLLTSAMTQALADDVAAASREPRLRFVVLRARGDSFCLGRDQEGRSPDELRLVGARVVALNETLRQTPLISICEVAGDAAGLGVGLVASCDVAIASDDARFWFPELEAGLAPTVVISWLGRLLPRKRGFDLVATGRRMGAAEALEWGLVTEVVSAGEVRDAADRWVTKLSEISPPALRDAKEFFVRSEATDEHSAGRAAVDALALGALRLHVDTGGGAEPG